VLSGILCCLFFVRAAQKKACWKVSFVLEQKKFAHAQLCKKKFAEHRKLKRQNNPLSTNTGSKYMQFTHHYQPLAAIANDEDEQLPGSTYVYVQDLSLHATTTIPKQWYYHLYDNLSECQVSQLMRKTKREAETMKMKLQCCPSCIKVAAAATKGTSIVLVADVPMPQRFHLYIDQQECRVKRFKMITIGELEQMKLPCCKHCLDTYYSSEKAKQRRDNKIREQWSWCDFFK